MFCHFTWNFRDYKKNETKGDEVDVAVLTTPVSLPGVDSNVLDGLAGKLVLDITKTKGPEKDDYQENYNIVYYTQDSKVIGSLYVVTAYRQPKSDTFETTLKNVTGTVSCKGIFSKFNNGTAIIEYDRLTGKRCLTLYPKN